jgi:cold shock CspA family protein
MDNIFKGKLKRWNDDKGFGFITPENGNDEVFIHISALKNMSRRPVIGDVILYQLHNGNDGKSKAINAKIDGVSFAKTPSRYRNDKVKHNWLTQIILIAVLISIGLSAYKKFTPTNNSYGSGNSISGVFKDDARNVETPDPSYKCDGRTYCSQMTSCEEAKFFISHCPNTEMDGDNDGNPCESQWCG